MSRPTALPPLRRLTRALPILSLAVLLGACGGSETDAGAASEDAATADEAQARRDSAVAESQLPGAGAVGTALEAVDRSKTRAEAHDTIG